jgi:hypothetical protein
MKRKTVMTHAFKLLLLFVALNAWADERYYVCTNLDSQSSQPGNVMLVATPEGAIGLFNAANMYPPRELFQAPYEGGTGTELNFGPLQFQGKQNDVASFSKIIVKFENPQKMSSAQFIAPNVTAVYGSCVPNPVETLTYEGEVISEIPRTLSDFAGSYVGSSTGPFHPKCTVTITDKAIKIKIKRLFRRTIGDSFYNTVALHDSTASRVHFGMVDEISYDYFLSLNEQGELTKIERHEYGWPAFLPPVNYTDTCIGLARVN